MNSKMRKCNLSTRVLVLSLLVAVVAPMQAQRVFSGAAEVEQSLHKLNELGTVLMIAAHPDDERTSVLAYFARGRHMRTAYLSLTRGEGGQNLIGSEQGAQLGLIRTHELLDARKIDGAEQFFTRAIDFGFTKTASETMEKWGRERILGDVVWVIRKYRPDVVMLVFTGTTRDGHGQHQTSAILGKDAFAAAGDPNRFPEQLKYVQVWSPKRLLHPTGGFGPGGPPPAATQTGGRGGRGGAGGGNAPAEPQLPKAGAVDTGAFNPILGYSYEELATISRSMHHSQGMGSMRRPGPAISGFELVGGAPATNDPFDGIDTTWNRLPGGAAVAPILTEAVRTFDPAHPERVIPLLAKARPLIAAINDPLAKIKLAELDETIALCAGLYVEAQPRQAEVSPGSQLAVTTTVLNRSRVDTTFESARMEGMWNDALLNPPKKLGYNENVTVEFTRPVPANQPYSQPYWLVKPPAGNVYTIDNQEEIGLPDSPPVQQVRVRLTVAGAPIELVRPVVFRYAPRAEGERERPLVVAPAVAVILPDDFAIFPSGAPRKIQVAVKSNIARAAGELRLEPPAGWKVEPRSRPFNITVMGEQQEMSFEVTPPANETVASLRAIATIGGREISSGMQTIAYPHIPTQVLFPPSTLQLVRSNIQVTVHKVGYIMGAGDEMPDALRQLGLDVTLLSKSDVETGDLSKYEAIVAGVRSYETRADLRANHPRLMEYVKNGGTYIVQYQTAAGLDPNANNGGTAGGRGGTTPAGTGAPGVTAVPGGRGPAGGGRGGNTPVAIGPYPIYVPGGNRYRITVEESPITFPHRDSRLLQTPNRITEKDFEGWVQERGLYFATEWDPKYETVLSSNDPGEEPISGGELWTRYGKGVYIFTAYSWFRQLPAGVPGAYRQFANLLSAR